MSQTRTPETVEVFPSLGMSDSMVIFVLRLDLSADDTVCHPAAVSGQCQSPHSHRVAGGRPRLALPVGQPPVQPEEDDQQGRCQCSPCLRQSTSTSQPHTKVRGEAGNLFDYFLAFSSGPPAPTISPSTKATFLVWIKWDLIAVKT